MEIIIEHYRGIASKREDKMMYEHYEALLKMLRHPNIERQPAWNEVAARWLDIIRKVWYERLKQPKRKKPLLLKDIRKDLKNREADLSADIYKYFQHFPYLKSPDKRIISCIIGVG